MIIWFGEHNGKDVKNLPNEYLVWLANRTEPPVPNGKDLSPAAKKAVRSKWKDLLYEVEEEIFEREEEDYTP